MAMKHYITALVGMAGMINTGCSSTQEKTELGYQYKLTQMDRWEQMGEVGRETIRLGYHLKCYKEAEELVLEDNCVEKLKNYLEKSAYRRKVLDRLCKSTENPLEDIACDSYIVATSASKSVANGSYQKD